MTRRWLRLAIGGGLAAGVLLACPAAASATGTVVGEPKGNIVKITNEGGELDLVFQTDNLPEGTVVDPSSVKVSIGGVPVRATSKALGDGTSTVPRRAVLAIDVSQSMEREGLDEAKAAANAFLDELPEGIEVGLVSFGADPHTEVLPTPDKERVRDAIDGLELEAEVGTALYDAAVAATSMAGAEGVRNVLLLTDGGESKDASEYEQVDAIARIRNSGVALNAVFFQRPDAPSGEESLRTLVEPAGGSVVTGGAGDLAAEFASIATAITEQLEVTSRVPARFAGRTAEVAVSAMAGDVQVEDTAAQVFALDLAPVLPPGPRPVTVGRWSELMSPDMLPVALGAFFLGILVLCAVAINAAQPGDAKRGRLRRRLSIYTLSGRQAAPAKQVESTALGSSHVARSAVELAGKVVQRRDFETALSERLEAGGVPLRPAEWMLIHVGIAIGSALLLLLISGGGLLATVIGLVLGLSLPWLYLSSKESRRKSAFLGQMPDTLQLIAGSLSAGYSMPQALDTVVREGQQPMTGEFNRALVEARLGVPVEDALDGVAARMRSRDFGWVVMAIRIQREVGGNLAELLTTVAGTMRERERLRRQVQVLSAEGRLSAWILGLLPVVFTVYIVLVRPAYLEPLYTETVGILLSAVGVVLLIVGVLWMRQSVRVEV